uniref:Terminase n=1 Tax=viral metagenome TaxID=1070528 RepID=A0A6M3KZ90_9ZZZZ
MESLKLTKEAIAQANQFAGFLSYQPNFIGKALMDCANQIVFASTGNRAGKTSAIMHDYVIRLLGIHPIESKNIRPNTPVRVLRFCSETLPMEPSGTGEVKNTIYPEFRKWFPPFLIKKDITIRKPVMTLRDFQGGPDVLIEFVSYNQEVQSQAGVDRFSCYLDEESPQKFFEEQIPRLITARTEGHGGDLVCGSTSTNPMTWMYDELYERASIIYRSPTIIEYLKKEKNESHRVKEKTDSSKDIAVIMAASDDNPLLNTKIIDEMLGIYGDPDEMAVRRYGIFRQMSGSIFKQFDWRIHFIKKEKYFPNGIPHNALHARMIDYHQHVPWAITWAFLTSTDEMFVYNEWNPAPENYVTHQIVETIASQSGGYDYKINLIDPLASTVQSNTGTSVLDDINRHFYRLRKEGYGSGGFWNTWDTKSPKGTDEIRKRLRNSVICGTPLNNAQKVNGQTIHLPTLWIFNTCKQTAMSLKSWRKKEYENKEMLVNNDQPDRANSKWSHFVMCLEGILKHRGFNYTAVPRMREETWYLPPKKEYFHAQQATR